MKTATCGICNRTEEIKPIEGRLPDLPPDWAVVSIFSRPITNRVVCPPDLNAIRTVMKLQ